MRNADRLPEQRFEIGAWLEAEMLPEESENLFFFVGDSRLQSWISNVIARTGIAIYDVFAFVEAALERQANRALLSAALYEFIFFVIQMVEHHPRDSFDDRGFTGAVLAGDGGRAFLEFEGCGGVRFDILKLDL